MGTSRKSYVRPTARKAIFNGMLYAEYSNCYEHYRNSGGGAAPMISGAIACYDGSRHELLPELGQEWSSCRNAYGTIFRRHINVVGQISCLASQLKNLSLPQARPSSCANPGSGTITGFRPQGVGFGFRYWPIASFSSKSLKLYSGKRSET